MIKHTCLILSIVFATLNGLAITVWSRRRALECFFKPATLVFLMVWVYLLTGFSGPLFWFGLGLFFSLLGDVLLLISRERLLPGLVAFLLAHVAYIVSFMQGTLASKITPLLVAVMIGIVSNYVLKPIINGLVEKGGGKLRPAIIAYGVVISIMAFFASVTVFRDEWNIQAAILVGVGAILFYLSDILLAWNRFVRPLKYGRLMNIIPYHLGQMLLAIGMVIQFS